MTAETMYEPSSGRNLVQNLRTMAGALSASPTTNSSDICRHVSIASVFPITCSSQQVLTTCYLLTTGACDANLHAGGDEALDLRSHELWDCFDEINETFEERVVVLRHHALFHALRRKQNCDTDIQLDTSKSEKKIYNILNISRTCRTCGSVSLKWLTTCESFSLEE